MIEMFVSREKRDQTVQAAGRQGQMAAQIMQIIIVTLLVAAHCLLFLIASSVVQTGAQQQMSWRGQELPEINGSVKVGNEIRDFVNKNVNFSFATATEYMHKV